MRWAAILLIPHIATFLELDEFSFDKVIKKFDAALVKFDIAFPYGEKHDAYIALAKDAKEVEELLIAEVGVKDYGEKDNEALARKYGAMKDNFPVVKLFLKGKSDPVTFDDTNGFTSDELRRFIREKSGIYLSLPGCIRQLDLLAVQFIKSDKENREKLLKETESFIKELESKNAASGKVYKTVMQKIIDKGDSFIKTEFDRVKKLTKGKLSEEKKKELGTRLNILQAFQLHEKQHDFTEKEEL
ncbi:Endoplasmic reticulum resident protein 29 [Eumeta japonica]|uniref:Endoplasmic reticulum resident protein 29 n=1 Tax=Eumeta variegata TaxID=151549 RepID=A0A4C1SGR2_EUMVA|nr:Endoplasmic reticulum resident protein 29 [Eumeta japonica]